MYILIFDMSCVISVCIHKIIGRTARRTKASNPFSRVNILVMEGRVLCHLAEIYKIHGPTRLVSSVPSIYIHTMSISKQTSGFSQSLSVL